MKSRTPRTRSGRRAGSRAAKVLRVDFTRQPAKQAPGGREAEFRFSVPVLRVRNVDVTVSWYRRYLGLTAATFPERAPRDFAILGRDGVQILVRRSGEANARRPAADHTGWDLYIWVDGADFDQLEETAIAADALVRPRRTMGAHIVELELRDPDGYVICVGGHVRAAAIRPA